MTGGGDDDGAVAWRHLDAALEAALALGDGDRTAYVDGLDTGVRVVLAPLLQAALAEDPLLDPPTALAHDAVRASGAPTDGVGVRVGAYEITGLVGEGGMGRVYKARRADGAYDRTVALKVVRQTLLLAGTDVAARLRRERALLAALDHPHIGRLIGGGETPDGVPYLVMEYVDGVPITEWAAGRDLSARVRMLAQVARAVDHAHQRFVVHRDLKPSNVLVRAGEGDGRPVVLDFGIAKLLDDEADAALTRTGVSLHTPAYAAPELLEPHGPLTTAVDVYGLGALLFEVLTGSRLDPTRSVSLGSRIRAERRPAVRSRLRDLETICRTALQRDPSRRYPSAAAFADDLERVLADRPIVARADSLGYVVARFVRRNRRAVALVAVSLAALVAGLSTSLVALADSSRAQAAAEAEAARAEEAVLLLSSVIEAANPAVAGTPDLSVREALRVAAAEARAVRSPALQGRLYGLLGQAYGALGDVGAADTLLRAALDRLETHPPPSPELHAGVWMAYADAAVALHDPHRAADAYRRVAAAHGADDPMGVRARGALLALPPFDESNPDDRAAALAGARRLVAEADARGDTLSMLEALDVHARVVNWFERRPAEAVRVARRAVDLATDALGPNHLRTWALRGQLERALSNDGQHDEAIRLGREHAAFALRVYGPMSYQAGRARIALANTLFAARRYGASAVELAAGMEVLAHSLPPGHVNFGWWTQELARAHRLSGQPDSAVAAGRRAVALAEAAGAPPLLARSLAELGLSLVAVGAAGEARPVLRRAEAALQAPVFMTPIYVREAERGRAEVRAALAAIGG